MWPNGKGKGGKGGSSKSGDGDDQKPRTKPRATRTKLKAMTAEAARALQETGDLPVAMPQMSPEELLEAEIFRAADQASADQVAREEQARASGPEFLKIPEPYNISEKQLEKRLIDNLQTFLLELGKGFTFVGRQYRITLDNKHYKVDLVFYHRILRCFVLLDLKIDKLEHADIGQMNMYMGYFDAEENVEGDNPPIGIILTREKNELLVKYATYGMNSQLFVSKYQLYLPEVEELRAQLEMVLKMEE